MNGLQKATALAMLPVALKFLADCDRAALVKDAGAAVRELIPKADDRARVKEALAGLAAEL